MSNIRIKNGIVEVCSIQLTAVKITPKIKKKESIEVRQIRYCKTQEEADEVKTTLLAQKFTVEQSEIDVTDKVYLDGVECTDIKLLKQWIKNGYITTPLTIDDVSIILADIIGGAL